MTKYTVISPFKDGSGRHCAGDVLEDVENAASLVKSGLIRTETVAKASASKQNKPAGEASEPEIENALPEKPVEAAPAPVPAETKTPASKKTDGKAKGAKA